jgi:hypothetical protein
MIWMLELLPLKLMSHRAPESNAWCFIYKRGRVSALPSNLSSSQALTWGTRPISRRGFDYYLLYSSQLFSARSLHSPCIT